MVFVVQRGVASNAETDNAAGIRIFTDDADRDRLRSGQYPHGRSDGRRGAIDRIHLSKGVHHLRRIPAGLGQHTVDGDAWWERAGAQRRKPCVLRD